MEVSKPHPSLTQWGARGAELKTATGSACLQSSSLRQMLCNNSNNMVLPILPLVSLGAQSWRHLFSRLWNTFPDVRTKLLPMNLILRSREWAGPCAFSRPISCAVEAPFINSPWLSSNAMDQHTTLSQGALSWKPPSSFSRNFHRCTMPLLVSHSLS